MSVYSAFRIELTSEKHLMSGAWKPWWRTDSGQPHCKVLLTQIADGNNIAASSLQVSWMKTGGRHSTLQGVSVYVCSQSGYKACADQAGDRACISWEPPDKDSGQSVYKNVRSNKAFGCVALCHNLIFAAPTCSVPCLVKVCIILLQMFVLPMLLL